MKMVIIRRLLRATAIVCILFSSCTKEKPDPDFKPSCKITQIKGDLQLGADSLAFAYNSKGDPVSVTRTHVGTGAPNYIFRYDQRRRLIEFIGIYGDNLHFEFRHSYRYDNRNRIVGDTTYTFGALTDPSPGFLERITTYTYDDKNRIIQADELHPPSGTTGVAHYTYNQDGNLEQVNGGCTTVIQYDDKVNMHRTHPLWQFLDRDFSVNNPFMAIAYSPQGLPVQITNNGCEFGRSFIGIYYMRIDVTYQCREHPVL